MNSYKQNKGNNYELFVLDKLKLQYDEVFFFKFTPERIMMKFSFLNLHLKEFYNILNY